MVIKNKLKQNMMIFLCNFLFFKTHTPSAMNDYFSDYLSHKNQNISRNLLVKCEVIT